jgi:hypothetical protein
VEKADADDLIACILEPELAYKAFRQNWARLIQKIYPVEFPGGNPIQQGNETDPLICPRCNGAMRAIAWIDDDQVTRLPRLSAT